MDCILLYQVLLVYTTSKKKKSVSAERQNVIKVNFSEIFLSVASQIN